MTLGRCPLNMFCSRGTPPREPTNPEALTRQWSAWRTENCTERYSSQFQNNCFTEMRSGSEEGSYLRVKDDCITQLLGSRVVTKKKKGGGLRKDHDELFANTVSADCASHHESVDRDCELPRVFLRGVS